MRQRAAAAGGTTHPEDIPEREAERGVGGEGGAGLGEVGLHLPERDGLDAGGLDGIVVRDSENISIENNYLGLSIAGTGTFTNGGAAGDHGISILGVTEINEIKDNVIANSAGDGININGVGILHLQRHRSCC